MSVGLWVQLAPLGACDSLLDPLHPRVVTDGPGPDAARSDAPAAFVSWGAYASSLQIPPCTGALTLEVDSTSTELDGGPGIDRPDLAGPELSLVEALQIAANRSDRVVIGFSEKVFPADAPATVLFERDCTLPQLANVCVDARSRGVILDFQGGIAGGSPRSSGCTLDLVGDALVVGLELRRVAYQVGVGAGSQLAGCRLNSDGRQVTTVGEPQTLVPSGDAIVGPGNSFGGTEGVSLRRGGAPTIVNNHFGFDPVTGHVIFNQYGVWVSNGPALAGAARVEDNVFRANVGVRIVPLSSPTGSLELVGNTFERGETGAGLGWIGVTDENLGGSAKIGPGNHFRRLTTAISLTTSSVTITRNTITECDAAIVTGSSSIEPPEITRASATRVEGRCVQAGLVEVFATRDDQADSYRGDASCSGGGTWRLDGDIGGPRVTATLTTAAGTSELSAPTIVSP